MVRVVRTGIPAIKMYCHDMEIMSSNFGQVEHKPKVSIASASVYLRAHVIKTTSDL